MGKLQEGTEQTVTISAKKYEELKKAASLNNAAIAKLSKENTKGNVDVNVQIKVTDSSDKAIDISGFMVVGVKPSSPEYVEMINRIRMDVDKIAFDAMDRNSKLHNEAVGNYRTVRKLSEKYKQKCSELENKNNDYSSMINCKSFEVETLKSKNKFLKIVLAISLIAIIAMFVYICICIYG